MIFLFPRRLVFPVATAGLLGSFYRGGVKGIAAEGVPLREGLQTTPTTHRIPPIDHQQPRQNQAVIVNTHYYCCFILRILSDALSFLNRKETFPVVC